MKFLKFFKKKNFKEKRTIYWDEPKWTPEMLSEIENIFKDFEIVKSESDDCLAWIWEIELNKDVDLGIRLYRNREFQPLAFYEVEAKFAFKRHIEKSWLEFDYIETWEELLERLSPLPDAYSYKALGKSYSKYWLEKLD